VIAVDPRSQGESDKPTYGHLPETRARDYKELVDHLGLKQPVLVGWSMACGELIKYVDQFGTDNLAGMVLVDGYLGERPAAEAVPGVSAWLKSMQNDRQQSTVRFVGSMYEKKQPDDYLKRVVDASQQTPTDTAAVLIYNMVSTDLFSGAFAKINRPVLFAYQPESQPAADLLKSKLGNTARLERFDGDGHALFVDDPEKFNRVLEQFIQGLPK
jgi:non-heme chloroperoxidase